MYIKMTIKDLLLFILATYWLAALRVDAFPIGQYVLSDVSTAPSNRLNSMLDLAALLHTANNTSGMTNVVHSQPHNLQLLGSPPASWSIGHHQRRQPRAVNLGRLRRLVNNVALSEYYRIRGLEVLDSFGVAYNNRPQVSHLVGSLSPATTTTTTTTEAAPTSTSSAVFDDHDLMTSASSSDTGVSLVLHESRILQKLRDAFRRDKTMQNIFDYLQDK